MHGESRAVRANYRTTHPTGSAMAKHHGGLGRAAQAPASSSGRAGAAPCCCWLPPPPSSVLAGRKAAGPCAAAALAGCSVRAWHTRPGPCSSQRGWSSCGAGGLEANLDQVWPQNVQTPRFNPLIPAPGRAFAANLRCVAQMENALVLVSPCTRAGDPGGSGQPPASRDVPAAELPTSGEAGGTAGSRTCLSQPNLILLR